MDYRKRWIPIKTKTTTKEGKTEYMREYMRLRRQELKEIPNLQDVLGLRKKKR